MRLPVPSAGTEPLAVPGILVGHDGSPELHDALDVALDLARALVVPILVVRVWSIDTAPPQAVFRDGYVASTSQIGATVRERLQADTATQIRRAHNLDVELRSVPGHPADVLIELSVGARMLVVGSRGAGGLAGMRLGSASERCVRHAHCPVLVVPHPGESRARLRA